MAKLDRRPVRQKRPTCKTVAKLKSTKKRFKRNKLSKQDITRLATTVKRSRTTKERYTFAKLAEVINDTKKPEDQVAASTVWNHKQEAKPCVQCVPWNLAE